MSFIKNLVNEYEEGQGQTRGQGGYQQSYDNRPPQVPAPWVAEWDQRNSRYIFMNRETGERTFEQPQERYGGGGYQQQGYGRGGYGQEEQRGEYYEQQQPQKKDHHGRNMALMGVAGLAGGALLMHEGENISESPFNISCFPLLTHFRARLGSR